MLPYDVSRSVYRHRGVTCRSAGRAILMYDVNSVMSGDVTCRCDDVIRCNGGVTWAVMVCGGGCGGALTVSQV